MSTDYGAGASVPLKKSFRFVHEPISRSSECRFVGRNNEMESLVERILFSEGGSFLVTGYRGVGKTSFINQVIRKLEEALPWAERFIGKTDLIDVYLNIARPVQSSEIMHYIIRQLYARLVEKGIYPLLDVNLQDALTLSYHRTSLNMARKLAESSEKSFGFNEASIGADWMRAAVKMSLSSKRNRSQNYEISYLGYDDRAAEYDLIYICRRLIEGYLRSLTKKEILKNLFLGTHGERVRLKIIFVFDELDKLEEFTDLVSNNQKPVIDQILGALKNLFTTSGVSFVFVAGKDLQERWLEDVGKGDSVYESVFSYDRYLPCLWADVDSICDGLIDGPLLPDRKIYDEFKQFLAYKGRGIPRRIIREFNQYVEWNGDRPVLAFSPSILRRIRFFAGLQIILKKHEKRLFGEAHEDVLGTLSDKRRLGVYYLLDWILRQGSSEFTGNSILLASKRLNAKIALAEEIAPNVAHDIIEILLNDDYIQEVHDPLNQVLMGDAQSPPLAEMRYRLTPRRLVELGGADIDSDPGFALPVDPTVPVGRTPITHLGKYKILKTVGTGGMGVVYEAYDEHTGRRVAIKMVDDEIANAEIRARFEREAMIMAELNHPNIVRLYDWGKGEHVYIVMEFLDGPTLGEIIKTQGGLTMDLALTIFEPIVEAIQYVHQQGFVRNDIKPNNIKLTSTGRICIIDFGTTRPKKADRQLLSNFVSTTGSIVGTPVFMAPEQFLGSKADERSDIYSLGIVLYNMLTGKWPFDLTGSVVDIFKGKSEGLLVPPSRYVPLPWPVEELILKCLQSDPNKRFQNAGELLVGLHDVTRDVHKTDLKSVASRLDKRIREVEAINHEVTAKPAAPADFSISLGRSAHEKSETGETTIVSHAIPRITLFMGSAVNIDFKLSRAESSYCLERKTTFGRSSENLIVMRDEKISRYHGQFDFEEKRWFVEDFNSNGGTYVNGERIDKRRVLKTGDRVAIDEFVFVFER
jgi:serine/threonine protein kinase/Cdc6-like AAA superfamily ATPase